MIAYYYQIADELIPKYGHKYFVTYDMIQYPMMRESATVIRLSNGVREIIKDSNRIFRITDSEFTLIILKSIKYNAEH